MKATTRILAGAACAALAAAPPLSARLEASMFAHMLIQIPSLFVGGVLLASGLPRSAAIERWNLAGVPGLVAVLLVWAYWMTPIALDRAVASAGWDALKVASLVLAGMLAARSWRLSPAVVHGFFVGNFVWMTLACGMLFRDAPARLCLAYLDDDQARAGAGLIALGLATAIVWLALLPGSLAVRSLGRLPR